MKAKWLLESGVFGEDSARLEEEVQRQGMEARFASGVPWEGDRGYLGLFGKGDCVVCRGSLGFAAQVRKEADWVPGPYCNEPSYDCCRYYPALARFGLLNSDYTMIPYGDLLRQEGFLFEHLGEQDCLFLRPSSVAKTFTGKLVSRERFEKDVANLAFSSVSAHELCVVAPPRNIGREWRFVVVERTVVAGSQYAADGRRDVQPGYSPEALALAEQVSASGYDPDPVWCLDVCRTRAGNYYLLEIGCFSCAGLYACDLGAVVREVSEAAVRQWQKGR